VPGQAAGLYTVRPQPVVGSGRAGRERCAAGPPAGFDPVALGFKEILFHFYFGLNSSLNFENSYLSVQYSKNL
jgi:hypothetical protein